MISERTVIVYSPMRLKSERADTVKSAVASLLVRNVGRLEIVTVSG